MKKNLILLVMAIVTMAMSSCSKKTVGAATNEFGGIEGLVMSNGVVENTVATDKEEMYTKVGAKYKYYETTIVLTDYLDADTKPTIKSVKNVMQSVIKTKGYGIATTVYEFCHNIKDGTNNTVVHENAFWVGDGDILHYNSHLITFETALKIALESNYDKPHSAYVVLRKPVGKKATNPLYIFGNEHVGLLFVDAITGEVTDKAPYMY